MKNRIGILITLIVIILSLSISSIGVASEFNFSVSPEIPNNQVDKNQSYFDLKMSPGQQQELSIKMKNATKKDVTVELSVNSAATNSNGVVEYGGSEVEADETLKYNLKDYVKIPDSITLEPNSEKVLKLSVNMPNESFNGLIAGGISFKEKKEDSDSAKADESQGLSIENEYSFIVALLMRQSEKNIAPDLVLDRVKAGQINSRNAILMNLQNPKPGYLNQLAVKAEITEKGSSEALYAYENSGMQMAPNSSFDLPVFLEGKRLKGGAYTLKLTAYGELDDKGEYVLGNSQDGAEARYLYSWNFEKDFFIEREVARELNKTDVTIEKDNSWLYILLGVLILAILLLIILLLKRNREEDSEDGKGNQKELS